MRNIIIIEAVSTGYNLVEDVIRRNYRPVVMELPGEPSEGLTNYRNSFYSLLYHKPEIIKACDRYEDTLELVRSYDPLLVLPGFEGSVDLATHLAEDLGLTGNPYSRIDAMTKKNAMHEALKEAGLRYIKGMTVTNSEDAVSFCRQNGLDTAVVKPVRSASSQGVYICKDLEEIRNAVDTLLTQNNIFNKPIKEVIVQEKITGTEYIVNTASSNGRHRLTSMFRYHKNITDEGAIIYDWDESLMTLDPAQQELAEYALKTADAIGFRYGVIHGEYMIDDKGPVLIEVNCRPMGGSTPAPIMDMAFGQHETDTMLDAYLDPDAFEDSPDRPYKPFRKMVVKSIMVPRLMEAVDYPAVIIAEQLKSTFSIMIDKSREPVIYDKTRDLDTAGGTIFLINDDEQKLMDDLLLLKRIEKDYFGLLLNDGMTKRWFKDGTIPDVDPARIIKDLRCHGATLALTDTKVPLEGVLSAAPDDLSDIHKGFDNVIIALQDSLPGLRENYCLKTIFEAMDKIKPGGRVIIPWETYGHLSYTEDGAKILLEIKGLKVSAAEVDGHRYVVGISER